VPPLTVKLMLSPETEDTVPETVAIEVMVVVALTPAVIPFLPSSLLKNLPIAPLLPVGVGVGVGFGQKPGPGLIGLLKIIPLKISHMFLSI